MRPTWVPRGFRIVSAIIAMEVTACSLVKPDREVDKLGRQVLQLVQSGDSTALVPALDPSLTTSTMWLALAEVRDTLRSWSPDSVTIVGWNVLNMPSSYTVELTYQLHGPGGWGLALLTLVRRQDGLKATGLRLERMPGSLQQLNGFTLSGRSWRHYFVLAMAALCALFACGAAFLVFRTPMPRRWLWAFIALVGVGQYGINWTTGETFGPAFRVQLFSAGYYRPGTVGQWLVMFSVPVGAVYALWRRKQFLGARQAETAADAAA
jgi:hypothetical protein